MKITYTGKLEAFPSKPRQKFEAKLQKLSKMLERKGEKEAHVIFTQERFLKKVEITVQAFDHAIVGIGSDSDLTAAAADAVEKLEKQVLKIRNKWRDTKRHKDKEAEAAAVPVPAAPPSKPARAALKTLPRPKKKVFRIDHEDGRKPMTAEEAVLEIDPAQDYMAYRDAKTGRLSVLFRRPDGNFDLIES